MESGLRVCHLDVKPKNLLAGGQVLIGVDFVAILVFGPDKEAGKRSRSGLVDHSLNLPDHAALANAGVRERSAAIVRIRVVEKIVAAVTSQRVGGRLQRPLRIQLEQKAAVFHRQRRRTFLAKINARPAAEPGGNQEAFRRPAMENKVEGLRTEHNSGDE